MKVTMLLADSAQAVGGKLYILGGGWSITGPEPTPFAIAFKIEIPWNEANRPHEFALELLDADGHPVMMETPQGRLPIRIEGQLAADRPEDLTPGNPVDSAAALNFSPLPLVPGNRYVWRLAIDRQSEADWSVAFTTRPADRPPAPAL
jgi:hypothetical protein